MRLIILGSSSPYAGPGEAGPGYLVVQEGCKILLECGAGVTANVQRFCPLSSLQAIVITHFHPDHCLDLFTLGFGLMMPVWRGEKTDPMPLFVPPGGRRLFQQLAELMGDLWEHYRTVFTIEEMQEGEKINVENVSLEFYRMKHSMEAHGVRITGERTIAYSGDTSCCDNLVTMARGADVLLVEAGMTDEGQAGKVNHLTPRQAGKVASEAGVRTLVLTHFPPNADRELSRQLAASEFPGLIQAASIGMAIET